MLTRAGYLLTVLVVAVAIILLFRLPQLGLFESGASVALGPAQRASGGTTQSVTGLIEALSNFGEIRDENAHLRRQVERLQTEMVRLRELERENVSLRSQLELKQSQPALRWQIARIVGRDTNGLVQSVILDRGSGDGLASGMTVMTTAGLVGQVVRVNASTAKVLLLTDISSSATGVLQESRGRGVVYGTRENLLVMRYIAQGDTVNEGEMVLTSGLGGVFPPGIPIGRVAEVRRRDIDMFQEAVVTPSVNFEKLEEVLVVTNHLPLKLD